MATESILTKELSERIESALDTIRPYLITDGGNVKVLALKEDMTLELELLGNCSSCSMSNMTLKAGVEQSIKKAVPEIKSVISINKEEVNEAHHQ